MPLRHTRRRRMASVTELKERHLAASETVNGLREKLKQKRLLLLDTDGKKSGEFWANRSGLLSNVAGSHMKDEGRLVEAAEILGLDICVKTLFGDATRRSISGGQRKILDNRLEARFDCKFIEIKSSLWPNEFHHAFVQMVKEVLKNNVGFSCYY